jgi:hypothetical protein
MSVQMIELEEVAMVDLSDDALEATVTGIGGCMSGDVCVGSWEIIDC